MIIAAGLPEIAGVRLHGSFESLCHLWSADGGGGAETRVASLESEAAEDSPCEIDCGA